MSRCAPRSAAIGLLLLVSGALAACGQRGELYLPDEAPVEVRQTSGTSSATSTDAPAVDPAREDDSPTPEHAPAPEPTPTPTPTNDAGNPAPQPEAAPAAAPASPPETERKPAERSTGKIPEKPR